MRICLIHPNYHSGGAEIAGNWPPAWVAYIAGALKSAGYYDIHFIDAMTDHVTPEQLRVKLAEIQPDVVGTTAITPSIYVAEETLKIAAEVVPGALRILGGIHATFMYQQVLSEAPHIDVIVRGEGEEIIVDLIRAYDTGRWPEGRAAIKGIAYRDGGRDRGDTRRADGQGSGRDHAGLVTAEVGPVHLCALGREGRHPQYGARLSLYLFVLQPVEILARLPRARSDQGGR